ncbi:hypothetical protein [Metamycoplasma hominis]|uniref:hypothetical protein n=1 Tax=Metamycoplasma hominis TaxID=2098 RepID=UPI001939D5D9|nr:hypothetical protein [Metamycoplasma hominis]
MNNQISLKQHIFTFFSQNPPAGSIKNGDQKLWIPALVCIILILFSLYLAIKFFVNFKRSIAKTKSILKDGLVSAYVQGFNIKSSAVFNFILANVISLVSIIISIISIVKHFSTSSTLGKSSFLPLFIAVIALSIVLIISINLSLLSIYFVSFKEAKFVNKKNLEDELISLKYKKSKELNDLNAPENIKLDIKAMESHNPLAPRVLAKFIDFYNKMSNIELFKRYKNYLNQTFKIRYFNESLEVIEGKNEMEDNLEKYLDNINNKDPELQKNSLILKEIAWMNDMDKKVKIIREADKNITMSKKEFQEKYDEYVYLQRSQDPAYQQTQKNTWLTYRDSDIEDLFYNTNTSVIYTIDNGKTILEKPMNEFLNEYGQYLETKFFTSIKENEELK